MATEQTPPESDLRGPRRRRRDVNTLLWLCGWGGITTVALIILAITTQTESANERLRHIFSVKKSPALAQISPRIVQLEFGDALSGNPGARAHRRARSAGGTDRVARKQPRRHDRSYQEASRHDGSRTRSQARSATERTAPARHSRFQPGRKPRSHPSCSNAERDPASSAEGGNANRSVAAGPRRSRRNKRTRADTPKTERIRSRPRWRRHDGQHPPTLDNSESQFRTAIERNVSDRGTRPSRRRRRLSVGCWPFAE